MLGAWTPSLSTNNCPLIWGLVYGLCEVWGSGLTGMLFQDQQRSEPCGIVYQMWAGSGPTLCCCREELNKQKIKQCTGQVCRMHCTFVPTGTFCGILQFWIIKRSDCRAAEDTIYSFCGVCIYNNLYSRSQLWAPWFISIYRVKKNDWCVSQTW